MAEALHGQGMQCWWVLGCLSYRVMNEVRLPGCLGPSYVLLLATMEAADREKIWATL